MEKIPVHNKFNERIGYSNGNVKLYVSDSRIIYRLYPFDIITERDQQNRQRSKNSHSTSPGKRKINLHNKKIALIGYGLCNDWQYFFTGTVDPKEYDASDFNTVSSLISSAFSKMHRKNREVKYCFILEQHQNGNFHAHGFCNLPFDMVAPYSCYVQRDGYVVKPSKSKFLQFSIKQCYYKLGLNVISPIESKNSVADYCSKYIIKDIASGDSFSKTIFKSHGLKSFEIEYGSYIGDKWHCFPGITTANFPVEDVSVMPFHSVGSDIWEMSIDLK